MATIDLSANTSARQWHGADEAAAYMLWNQLDFSANNAGASDVIQAITVPAGFAVIWTAHKVVTAEGGTSTGDIGDGADPNGWQATVDNNAAADTMLFSNLDTSPAAYAALGGKLYAASDTIDMTLSANAVDTAVILIFAFGFVTTAS